METSTDIKESFAVTRNEQIWREKLPENDVNTIFLGLPNEPWIHEKIYALAPVVLLDSEVYAMRSFKTTDRETAFQRAKESFILHSIFAVLPVDGSTEYWVRGYWIE